LLIEGEVSGKFAQLDIKYKRVILKFSGEVLKGNGSDGVFSNSVMSKLCDEIAYLHNNGIELGVVLGGGNIFRGASANVNIGCDRIRGDYIGMLSTVINSMAVADTLTKHGVPVNVFSVLMMPDICSTYYPRSAQKSMEDGNVLLLAGGTGSAFFSTDSAAALRANELHADVVVKATKVGGVYNKDPQKFPDAKKFDLISFDEVLSRRLHVMDSTAFSLCMENNIPIIVVDAENDMKNIWRALCGEMVGTIVCDY
jgi:uridylate kinase